MKTNEIFREYGNNPIALFSQWFDKASLAEPVDANAMALATVDAAGRPHVRIVLLKDFDEKGFVFFTNYEGGKGCDLAAAPVAEVNFYWKSLSRQVRISGGVEKISAQDSDAYFQSRGRGKQIGAWASPQSRAFDFYDSLEHKTIEMQERFEGQDIPRPPHWGGFRIRPERMEFWIAEQNRLHTRFVYSQDGDAWTATWLYP